MAACVKVELVIKEGYTLPCRDGRWTWRDRRASTGAVWLPYM